jgi:Uncharacterized protein conserved in bacteria
MKFITIVLVMIVGWIPGALAGIGFIAGVQGDAWVIRQSESLPATIGFVVELGDRLVTGRKSRIKVLFSDDSLLTVASETELTITEHIFKPKAHQRKTVMELVKGKMRALVQKEVAGVSGAFEVHTNNAVAGVRGTEFVVSATDTELRLWTISGDMDVVGSDGVKTIVVAGEGCEVLKGIATAPHAVAQAELNDVRQETDLEQSPTALALNLDIGAPDRISPSPTAEQIKSNEGWSQEPKFGNKIESPNKNQVTTFYGNASSSPGTSFDVQSRNWNNQPTAIDGFSHVIITVKMPK